VRGLVLQGTTGSGTLGVLAAPAGTAETQQVVRAQAKHGDSILVGKAGRGPTAHNDVDSWHLGAELLDEVPRFRGRAYGSTIFASGVRRPSSSNVRQI